MSTNPRGPNPIDRHVGARVRLRRQLLNMSQEKLGDELGVTFQQVQKYERGANRIGAGRLWVLARTLDVPVSFFYEGVADSMAQPGFAEGDQTPIVDDFIQSADGVALAQAFAKIRDSRVRRRVLELVRTLAAEEAEAAATES
ncbi:MAG: helix-turn-helix transcriptional regulator [Pseudomonadota bacterium]